jgi:hypothetical protein
MRKPSSKPPLHPPSGPPPLADDPSPNVPHREQDRGNGDGNDDSDVSRLGRTILRYRDLEEAGLISSWAGLGHAIRDLGFPRGRHFGPRTRIWFADEILAWLDALPLAPVPKDEKPHSKQPTGRGRGRPRKVIAQPQASEGA